MIRIGSKVLGWHLVVGSLVFAIMTLTLAAISEDVVRHEPLSIVDAGFSRWLELNGSPLLTSVMLAITSLGATWAVTGILAAFVFYLLRRRGYYWIAVALSSVVGGMLLNRLLKFAFQRPRPSFENPILTFTGYSFPSGHTMAATVLFGTLAAYFVTRTSDTSRRVLIIAVAGLLMVLVAFSRIYLGAHCLSDVLAAMAEGLAWIALCLTLAYSLRRQRESGKSHG